MISVIGSESVSAFLKSSAKAFDERLVGARAAELADEDAGWRACTRSTAASTGSTDFSAAVSSPRSLKVTRTERPSLEIWLVVALGVRATGRRRRPWLALDGGDGLVDRGCGPRRARCTRALDDDALDVLRREVRVDELVRLAGVADVGLVVLGRLDADARRR